MEKYKGKYRIASARWQHWNYGWSGAYFITICTKNRVPYFGDIKNKKQVWSPIGVIADILWYEIKNHAKNITLGEFVVMPNHIHGILVLNNNSDNVGDSDDRRNRRDKACLVSTQPPQPPQPPQSQKTIGQQRFQNQGKNTISSIVGGINPQSPNTPVG